jgi:hypothetical protein
MIIRSQDKKAITDDLKLYIRENDFTRDKVKWEIRNAEQDLLATYSTEEKAIKVLDMIQSAYNAIETMKIDKGAWRDNHYFQMPSDEEVEV